jgi:hypothetical protein
MLHYSYSLDLIHDVKTFEYSILVLGGNICVDTVVEVAPELECFGAKRIEEADIVWM